MLRQRGATLQVGLDLARDLAEGAVELLVEVLVAVVVKGRATKDEPRHRMSFNSTHEGLKCGGTRGEQCVWHPAVDVADVALLVVLAAAAELQPLLLLLLQLLRVGAQLEVESKVKKRFIILYLQALKP